MKILLTGASGMLAAEITPQLIRQKHQVIETDAKPRNPSIQTLDITAQHDVVNMITAQRPDFVFHLAAETNVDLCEQNPDHAFRVNTLGTENIALACQKEDVPLLYISTAGVFPGDKKEPYTEFDDPKPVNVYGVSKFEGEKIVQRLLSRYFIIRAGWMVGGWEIDKKFVFKIIQQLKEGKTELKAVADKFGSPTFTKDFAANLMNIVETDRYGIYHLANKGTASRFDIAVKIVEFMGLAGGVKVSPVGSDQFPLPAPRANSEMMRNYRLELLGLNQMPHWEESLKNYIQTNKDK
jgi:dTDP-4-dehydrorhamnose reductase